MNVKKLIETLDSCEIVSGDPDKSFNEVVFDSRKTSNSDVFVAVRGMNTDGHQYIEMAIDNGVIAVVGEEFTDEIKKKAIDKNVCLIKVYDSAHDGGIMVAASCDFPANKLVTIGVTGTDGKTTTTNLLFHLLKSSGKKVGLISTISARIFAGDDKETDTGFHVTTPDVCDVQKYIAEMVNQGCEYAIIESTSHAFDQERLAGINFDVGVITNITHEHLDYHKTIDKYIMAKAKLFRIDNSVPNKVDKQKIAVINQDDKSWDYMKPYLSGWSVVGYGFEDFSHIHALKFENTAFGSKFILQKEDASGDPVEQYQIESPLFGKYNAYNLSAALTTLSELGFSIDDLSPLVAKFNQLAGRFEVVSEGGENYGKVVVDFAHTPNALEKVLDLGRSLTRSRLIVVFGCAGLRDREKRMLMGKIAGQKADIIIVTAEDPRTERVEDISKEIAQGLVESGAEEFDYSSVSGLAEENSRAALVEHFPIFIQIPDRKKAIVAAVALSNKEDIVLVCGKGHEKSMCFGIEEIPWSDQEVVIDAINLIKSV